ncbi:hypothetical protein LCGC14_2494270, partial [marine sediment metagenome]
AIKHIYRNVLIDRTKIKYFGKDKYILTRYYSSGKKREQIEYKNNKAKSLLHTASSGVGKINFKIKDTKYAGKTDVFDITVTNKDHTFWCNGFNISNCGEQILPEMSICCLGNIVLPTHLNSKGEIDWGLLDDTIRLSVRFLDDVLDVNEYPITEIKEASEKERRIGLGIMGLHDMLLKMGIKYSSDEALKIIDKVMSFIKKKAYEASIFLSVKKGQFPLLDREQFIRSGFCKQSLTPSIRKKILEYGIRNCCILTAPPTGTVSIVAGVSSGTEPMFAPIYQRNFNKHKDTHSSMTNKSNEVIIHPLVKEFLKTGKSIDHFEAAHDISPEHHCKVQEVCQRHIDAAVSKTINLPGRATTEELSDIILEYLPRLKGLTIYRDGSRGESPLMPMPISEIKKYLNDDTVTQSGEGECLSGSCDI